MAQVKAKAAPAAQVEEGGFVIGDTVTFNGYPEGTPEAEMVLTEGESYPVIGLPGVEDGQETGYILQVPNPKFNAKKKANPDTNPEFFEVEAYGEELTLAEEAAEEGEVAEEGAEEEGITFEEVQAMAKADLLALATANEVKLTPAQKKTEQTLRDALCAAFGLEPAAEDEPEEEQAEEGEGEAAEGEEEPLTLAELRTYDKAALLELATANEVKLTPAQKKTEATLIAALAAAFQLEEEEVVEEPVKPAAKAAAKAAPAKAAATAKAAPAKASTKAAPAVVEEDELPDLEGEDESVLALVSDSADLIATAQGLESDVAANEYRFGGVLYHIKREGAWKEINPEYKEKGGWALFLQEHFNINYRKAQYLIEIYIAFTQSGIENPSEVIGNIGWTKAQKIAEPMLLEGEDPAKWIEAAENNTVADLSAIIKDSIDAGDGTPGSAGTQLSRITLKFRYLEEDAGIINDILTVAKDTLGVDEGDALLHIAKEWAVQNNIETVAKAKETTKAPAKPAAKVAASAPAKPAAKAAPAKAAPAKAAPAKAAPAKPAAKAAPAKAAPARKAVAK